MERNPKLVIRLDTDKGEQQEDCAQQHADEGRPDKPETGHRGHLRERTGFCAVYADLPRETRIQIHKGKRHRDIQGDA